MCVWVCTNLGGGSLAELARRERITAIDISTLGNQECAYQVTTNTILKFYQQTKLLGYICVCVCVCTYIYVCVHIYIYKCVYICVCIYIYIYVCVCVYVCVYIYIYICVCVCVYVYMCVCIYICLYVCVCIYMCECVFVSVCLRHGRRHFPKIQEPPQNRRYHKNDKNEDPKIKDPQIQRATLQT